MKTIKLISLRTGIVTVLCASLIINSSFLYSSSEVSANTTLDIKSEAQYRSEAARYDAAIRAISVIATMKLDTPDDLMKAVAIIDREHDNLKFRFSKFVVISLGDSTFVSAARKKLPDKQAEEAFAKVLEADRNAILKIDGAEALKSRIQRSSEAEAATLRRAGKRLKEAAEKVKKAAAANAGFRGRSSEGFGVIRAAFNSEESANDLPSEPTSPLEPLTTALIIGAIIVTVSLVTWVAGFITHDVSAVEDEEEECVKRANDNYFSCFTNARSLPPGFPLFIRETALALCYGQMLLEKTSCHFV